MPRTGKVSKAPPGFYTAQQAIKRLRMPPTTFHHYVRTGKIKKKTPVGRSEGYYEKAYIDKMAQASELFAIQYAEDPATYTVATPEDAQGIYDVNVSVWGPQSATPQARLAWYQVNPEIDYVVKQDDIVTGYFTIKPHKHEIIERLITREIRGWDIKPEDILPFTPGVPLECYVGVAVRAGLHDHKKYGMRLMAGAIQTLQEFAERAIMIKRLYATSDTPDGIRICRGLGFDEVSLPNASAKQFMLDLETSDSPYAQAYRQILAKSNHHRSQQSTTLTAHLTAYGTDDSTDGRNQTNKKFSRRGSIRASEQLKPNPLQPGSTMGYSKEE